MDNSGTANGEIDDPQIEVSIQGTDIVLKQADQGKDVTVTPGDRILVIKRGDFSFETDKLILKKGPNVTVRVELLADQIKVYQGDSLLGQSKLSQGSEQPHPVVSSPPAGVSGGVTAAESKLTAAEPKPDVSATYSNSIGMQFVSVPKGTAWLGGGGGTQGETKVVIEQDFFLGKYEVTHAPLEAAPRRALDRGERSTAEQSTTFGRLNPYWHPHISNGRQYLIVAAVQ